MQDLDQRLCFMMYDDVMQQLRVGMHQFVRCWTQMFGNIQDVWTSDTSSCPVTAPIVSIFTLVIGNFNFASISGDDVC